MSADLYQTVTDRILESLEAGVAPWVKPWKSAPGNGLPFNASSGKAYRGINVALLYAPQYASSGWMTFNQAKTLGGHVRKGERGSKIVFFKPFVVRDKNSTDEEATRTIPLLREFTVFNVEQIEGLPAKFYAQESTEERPAHSVADAMLGLATVRHGGDRACYSPSVDAIQMPNPAQFDSVSGYYATALHELTHWTGHASRCAREYGKRFGDTAYAREELVAEMGAAFLCARAGIDGQLQHAAYLQSWIDVLKSDKRAIVIAAAAAQKAADFVINAAFGAVTQDAEEESAA